jgi:arylsulfatase
MTSASTPVQQPSFVKNGVHRRNMLAGGASLLALTAMTTRNAAAQQPAQSPQLQTGVSGRKPNILVIFGDDIGQTNISAYSFGLMGDRTPNIDRIAREGMMFTDYGPHQNSRPDAGTTPFRSEKNTNSEGAFRVPCLIKADWRAIFPSDGMPAAGR